MNYQYFRADGRIELNIRGEITTDDGKKIALAGTGVAFGKPPVMQLRQTVTLRQGIDRELAKKLVQGLKDSKLKVQAAIQGEELRISGKKRDDLQAAIAHIRSLKLEQPLQFVNFRE